ncbi:hypothetical protein ACFT5B_14185 [Luteimicrobium sp. NPDC057192]|uniref:hypothetical protein n=1 Tax=Luteimicrobium sp. NPDC057192 TaxID=3346042 RepID=UPI00362B9C68
MATTLQEYVGAPSDDAAFVAECEAQAGELVARYLVGPGGDPATASDVVADAEVYARVLLEVGSELYARRGAPSGITSGPTEGDPVRLARDPMSGVYPILDRYMVRGL